MSRIFISHSSRDDGWAIALSNWLVDEGWCEPGDIFLDLDPERGIAAGQKWQNAFADAAARCEVVFFVISEHWLASTWCRDEYHIANKYNKKMFALAVGETLLDNLPQGLRAQWQIVRLTGEPAERFVATHPVTRRQWPIHIATAALAQLKNGLRKAGLGPGYFELSRDQDSPYGWRLPYRGLEALDSEYAAVFFGRSADLIRSMDALRGLATGAPPRVGAILGASGAGKSSFLRAGLWPRLLRDDLQWLPLRPIRAGYGGAIEGREGLLDALQDALRRYGLERSRSAARECLDSEDEFIRSLRTLRRAAAKRALSPAPPHPLAVICLDQGEEFFGTDANPENERLLRLLRAAVDAGDALLLATIRTDAYDGMQNSAALAGIDPLTLSLGPVPQGEIGRIIREPAQILRRHVGARAPVFDELLVERLQAEFAGEADALPLLAFVLQRLMHEHMGEETIGLGQVERTGGLTVAIESAAEAAFRAADYADRSDQRREALRNLFVPALVRISRDSKVAQRAVARQTDLLPTYRALARALTERRLLVVRARPLAAAQAATGREAAGHPDGPADSTIEVAHEALLRRWTMLAEILGEDRDALLLLDGVRLAAADWNTAAEANKSDFLAHHGSRLAGARALGQRGPAWASEIAAAQPYLDACIAKEEADDRSKRSYRLTSLSLFVVLMIGFFAFAYYDHLIRWVYWHRDVRPFIRSADEERLLWETRAPFRECRDCPDMIIVDKATFDRGGPLSGSPDERRESPVAPVEIRKSFAVSVTEITFAQWDRCADHGVCRSNVSGGAWGRGDQPVIHVSWTDAQNYVSWLSQVTGKRYRLLSESEWELAARGGRPTNYSFQDRQIKEYAWYWANADGMPRAVGGKKPNPYGLRDMNGNVAEWVEDCFHETYHDAPSTEEAWTTGAHCHRRVVRGGHWLSDAAALRSASRDWRAIGDDGSDQVGIRVARDLTAPHFSVRPE